MSTVPPFEECQRRFVLYCIAHGLQPGDEWKPYKYMAWICKMEREYKISRGIQGRWTPIDDQDDFTLYIEQHVRQN
ncbi:hypothetical protein [Alicyclobacillus acidoterrestris]|uniref:Uncharacterized protein n=1 Tax=Alicyclobacillus acidoterrestris (strain ATCC 49025 / DSM 3922 / CIP 106132 / NCIMB 13137 / GD3B) TaxID=1356854 RepID=T0C561_ALIAG|nr:hypothetical protein [Alicyclobacillus acidoterrestris]EPZ47685.1 hypothetical protein N007_05370 [Alicyclobacillus acidoterrestris ATCC 49025]UNO47996.1 hypothetical protein K1I37_15080 [Alicyclobacillus acidoterrestris]